MVIALIVLFSIHLLAFALLWWRRRERHLLWLVLTFTLLVSSCVVTLVAPTIMLGTLTLDWVLRIAAWSASALALVGIIKRSRAKRRTR